MRTISIYWATNDRATIDKIRSRFGIGRGMTVNGVQTVSIKEEDWDLFQETVRRGFIQIRHLKTCV